MNSNYIQALKRTLRNAEQQLTWTKERKPSTELFEIRLEEAELGFKAEKPRHKHHQRRTSTQGDQL